MHSKFQTRSAFRASLSRRPRVTSVAMMVCTRERPELLQQWLLSVGEMNVPAGVKLHVVIADNNETSIRHEVEGTAAQFTLDLAYVHEPCRGYSNARNAAVEAALATDAQLLIFTDDDQVVEPDLLIAYIAFFEPFES